MVSASNCGYTLSVHVKEGKGTFNAVNNRSTYVPICERLKSMRHSCFERWELFVLQITTLFMRFSRMNRKRQMNVWPSRI